MALDTTAFQAMAIGPVKLFIYKSTDAVAATSAADYFFTAGTAPADGRDIRDSIKEHDVIMVIDTTNDLIDFLLVTASTASTITTVNANT